MNALSSQFGLIVKGERGSWRRLAAADAEVEVQRTNLYDIYRTQGSPESARAALQALQVAEAAAFSEVYL